VNATWQSDFVVLHNRGVAPIDLTGKSLQYASPTNTGAWTLKQNLSGSVAGGAYFLIKLNTPASPAGMPLPIAPDLTGSIDMGGTNGKVALVSDQVLLGSQCPTGGTVIDIVGYGTANCTEGGAAVGALSSVLSAQRVQSGCGDVNKNVDDFITATPVPFNSATPAAVCSCLVKNESNATLEADYCNVQSPLLLNPMAGSMQTVYGRIYEAGMTDVGGIGGPANANIRAQLGWGLPTANPQYQSWNWFNASFNALAMDASNDEYQASFTAPAVGTYRYVYRFSLDQGVTWTVCDKNAAPDFGAGSNPNLTFEFADMPVMTVP
jgi:hypothetical protein